MALMLKPRWGLGKTEDCVEPRRTGQEPGHTDLPGPWREFTFSSKRIVGPRMVLSKRVAQCSF